MWQCRKIYANLLLLSVLLFALGATTVPRINGAAAGQTAWRNAETDGTFQWECCSGKIVYRGQQITALAGSELDVVLPEKVRDILNTAVFVQKLPESCIWVDAEIMHLPQERGPPAQYNLL